MARRPWRSIPTRCWHGIASCRISAKTRSYKAARGKGGFVRSSWKELNQLIAAANVWTIKHYGPDRVARLLADPGDVDGLLRRGHSLFIVDWRHLPELL
ncbi:hypothetical protein [Klebsiella pneumoniae]|uniref:hypothetical protein n=1 Tax=Klebsiella pneumoniae TaxID=573 RepID=UPI003A914251